MLKKLFNVLASPVTALVGSMKCSYESFRAGDIGLGLAQGGTGIVLASMTLLTAHYAVSGVLLKAALLAGLNVAYGAMTNTMIANDKEYAELIDSLKKQTEETHKLIRESQEKTNGPASRPAEPKTPRP